MFDVLVWVYAIFAMNSQCLLFILFEERRQKNSSDFALVINKLEERFYDCLALFLVAVLALRHLTASRMNVDVFTAAQLFTLILLAIGYLCLSSENTRLYFSVLLFRG